MPSAAEEDRRRAALDALRTLHGEIDREADRLTSEHAERLRCGRGCSACCLDKLTISPVEAELIRETHGELLANAEPHAAGACAFLDEEGACRVYAERPSVCRSQGLPLRMFFEDDAGEIEEHRDICPLNAEGGPPLEGLAEESLWLVGPFELRLASIEDEFMGEASCENSRIALRSLFRSEG